MSENDLQHSAENAAEAEDTTQEWMDLELKLFASLISDQEGIRKYLSQNLRDSKAFTFIPNAWAHAIGQATDGHHFQLDSFSQLPNMSAIEKGLVSACEHILPMATIEETEMLAKKIKEKFHVQKFMEVVANPTDDLASGKIDYKTAMEILSSQLEALSAETADKESVGLGIGHDTQLLLDRLFSPEAEQLILTGFAEIDDRAGGLAKGEQIICACPTSAGKTTFMNQLCLNMGLGMKGREYLNPVHSTLIISLEMSEEQMWRRILANLCGIEVGRFRRPAEMSDAEKQLVGDTARSLASYLANSGHRLTLKGASAADLGSIRAELASHPYDVVCIDYLNLMAEGDQLWSEMGKIGRELKLLAQKRKFVCVTAAQLDEDSLKIRYSRMVKEHCDMVLMWAPAPAASQGAGEVTSAYTEIFVDKGRNTGKFSFWVHFNFAYMTVSGVNPSEQLRMFEPQVGAQQSRLPTNQVLQVNAPAAAPAAQAAPALIAHEAKDPLLAQLNAMPLGANAAPTTPAAVAAAAAPVYVAPAPTLADIAPAIATMSANSAANLAPAAQMTTPTSASPFVNANAVSMPGSLPAGVLTPGFNPLSFAGGSVAEDIKAETMAADDPQVYATDDMIEL